MKSIRICAVLSAFNRRDKTIAALEAFFGQEGDFELSAVLMDDGSTDGTGEAVQSQFKDVTVLKGDGSLFWNRGMSVAYKHALTLTKDYYLWLNDDSLLDSDALIRLVGDAVEVDAGKGSIVVGSTRDPSTRLLTYGGLRSSSSWHPGKFSLIEPKEEPLHCDAMNGNIVLISDSAAECIGGIDEYFSHSMGDYDYALCANRLGVSVVVGSGLFGDCPRNPESASWDKQASILKRYRKATSVKGLPPREWAYFLKKHGNYLWPFAWISTYRRILLG